MKREKGGSGNKVEKEGGKKRRKEGREETAKDKLSQMAGHLSTGSEPLSEKSAQALLDCMKNELSRPKGEHTKRKD